MVDLKRGDSDQLLWRGVYHDTEEEAAKLADALTKNAATLLSHSGESGDGVRRFAAPGIVVAMSSVWVAADEMSVQADPRPTSRASG